MASSELGDVRLHQIISGENGVVNGRLGFSSRMWAIGLRVNNRREIHDDASHRPDRRRRQGTADLQPGGDPGGLVFVSGTGPFHPETGRIVGETIQEQTAQCLKNIAAILEAAGSSLDKVASATVILAEEDDFAGMNEEWLRWFPSNPPARQGAKLPLKIPGFKISIAMIAEA